MSALASETVRRTAVRWVRAAHAEWLKFRTLPSNSITVTAACAVIVGSTAALLSTLAAEHTAPATTEVLTGVSGAQFPLALLAVVTICSEWASNTSQVTFLAVPTRWPVLAGKVMIVGAVALLTGLAGAAGALVLGAATGIDVGATPGLTARLVAGAGLYLGTLAVLALAIGAIVRNLVGSILTVLGFLWLVPFAAAMTPVPRVHEIALYLPASAGITLIAPENPTTGLTPWGGYAVLLAWTVAALAGAVVTLRARDV